MRKDDSKVRYCVQHENHARVVLNSLCSLMEHQSLVDLAIRCGNNTIHAHKCILAANSPYFREQLEKNVGTEQVVVSGIEFSVMKAVVEFMYCGETQVVEDHLKQLAAVAKLFQIRGLPGVAPDHIEQDNGFLIPPPIFLSKKPKYSSAYVPYSTAPLNTLPTTSNTITTPSNINPALTINNMTQLEKLDNSHHQQQSYNLSSSDAQIIANNNNNNSSAAAFNRRLKRKYVRTEAEKACAKEAAASRLALETIQKELASSHHPVSTYVLDDHQLTSTVNVNHHQQLHNYITQNDQSCYVNQLEQVPLQVVNYDDGNLQKIPDSAAEKIKNMFGQELPSNVEIMFKTSDGHFVNVTDEMLQAITREALQFQVIDENGHASEIQFLKQTDDKQKLLDPKYDETFREFLHPHTVNETFNAPQVDEETVMKENSSKVIKAIPDSQPVNKVELGASMPTNLFDDDDESVLIDGNRSGISGKLEEVLYVEGIGNVVCSETIPKEDVPFFEVNQYFRDNYKDDGSTKIDCYKETSTSSKVDFCKDATTSIKTDCFEDGNAKSDCYKDDNTTKIDDTTKNNNCKDFKDADVTDKIEKYKDVTDGSIENCKDENSKTECDKDATTDKIEKSYMNYKIVDINKICKLEESSNGKVILNSEEGFDDRKELEKFSKNSSDRMMENSGSEPMDLEDMM